MIRVACPTCQTKYRFDESQLGGKPRVTTKCKKCGGVIEIEAPESDLVAARPTGGAADDAVTGPSATAPARREQDTTARVKRLRSDEPLGEATMTGQRVADLLDLPQDKKYSLAVLQGKASGQIFQIQKVKTVLGRADCDIVLDDPECSRQHASLEILGSRVVVNDLNSTNGTFVQGARIQSMEIENHNEFRVGEHVLMLIVTDRE
ncbi:MAG: FHA domain-containing protein [Vicinamibacteria bacterium]